MSSTTPQHKDTTLDDLLDMVYDAGYKQSRLQLEGKGANTITSEALWKAKQAILKWRDRAVVEALEHLYVANGNGHIFVEFPEAQIPLNQYIAKLKETPDED